MYDNKKYKKVVLYIEACESCSLMIHLPNNIDVHSATVPNPHESSYAFHYGKNVNWIEDSDVDDLSKETLQTVFTGKATHQYQSCDAVWKPDYFKD
ncbi:hypothetical protein AB205_0037930 [Aquarana catesbeiana]|uniref:Uncharacterized protein n=1 Tax=Aquarana catesbeiana TaxID=8400 RepID=A0A2G9Q9M0_AQUCT|nr:hypothetical protein AB205_0037930 [Aquarana catesbeiana]